MPSPIDRVSTSISAQRARSPAPAGLRNDQPVLNAIVKTQRKSGSVALVPPDGASSKVKLPRGSLVDVLA